jgi:hypothetical protein
MMEKMKSQLEERGSRCCIPICPVLSLGDHQCETHGTDTALCTSTYVCKTVHVPNPSRLCAPMERQGTPNQSVFSYVPGTTDRRLTEDS